MSRTYEALKKAERQQQNGHPTIAMDRHATSATAGDGNEGLQLQYDRLRVWMANQGHNGSGVRIVMVAACRPRSGTTSTVAGLATALSDQPSVRVLIVDANLRTPELDRVYNADNTRGFSELLTKPPGDGELPVQTTRRANLFLLTAGLPSRSPVAIFERTAIERLVASLREGFDFVIFDAPPLLQFPEGYALAPHVDAVLLVVDAQHTSLEEARRATRELERVGVHTAGVVLNRERDYTPRVFRRFFSAAK